MKPKYSIALLLFCVISNYCSSQTWPIPGAHWEYCRGGFGANFRIFEYTKDTIINSKSYQVIDLVNSTSIPYLGAVYTRYSNDTVYRYVQSKDYPFLIFNGQIGDIYTTFRTRLESFADSACNSILPLQVLDLDTVNYASLSLERWKLKDTLFDDIYTGVAYPPCEWFIAERIGFLNDFPFTPDKSIYGNNCNLGTDAEEHYVLSYYSDSSYVYDTGWNCSVGLSETSIEDLILVYPNPANDQLYVDVSHSKSPTQLTFQNILGQELFKSSCNNEVISIKTDGFPPGSYILKLSFDQKLISKNVMIIH